MAIDDVLNQTQSRRGLEAETKGAMAMARTRSLLAVLVSVLASLFLALLAYILFVAFPAVAETGDAQLQAWLGPQGGRFGYMLLGALISAPYVWVSVRGTRDLSFASAYPWLVGALVGGIAGLAYVSLAVVTGLLGWRDPLLGLGLIILGAPSIAGIAVGKATGRAGSAILGGFWCGLLLALVVATGWAARDLLLAGRLTHTVWASDTFRDARCSLDRTVLAACEIGDELGGLAIQLLLLPLIGGALGGLVGLPWRAAAMQRAQVSPGWSRALSAPAVFSVIMVVVLAAELTFKLR
jgi:hypothetical protein